MYFDSLHGLLRVVGVGVPAYVALVVLLRLSGKRTLSKMNAFDLVVTVAIGSTLGSIITSRDVALAEGVLALALLVGMQFLVAWLSTRSRRVSALVKAEPRLLYFRGSFLDSAMSRERVSREEVLAAVRLKGLASLDGVTAVVLETSGEFAVTTGEPSVGGVLPMPQRGAA